MHILGIETSCDETAASMVRDGRIILSNTVASSLKEHERFGGIIPEIASRKQLEFIHPVVKQALEDAGCALSDIDAVSVTQSPGLLGSLLVGRSYGRSLAFALDRPCIPVDHIKAHLYANFLRTADDTSPVPELPAVGLIVSGGHTSLYHVTNFTDFRLLGSTRDDAAGECFDKVARILGLGYPGGPAIDRLANSNPADPVKFNPARLPGSFDFSFSGTKTAVLYHHQKHPPENAQDTARIARGFQDSVVGILTQKTIQACRETGASSLIVGGGVAANSALRRSLAEHTAQAGINLHIPPLYLCMDNAAMIAGYGYHLEPVNIS
ncbi:MAG: tRNA (adenosine(37)-N6)-threonylcarbamoyltransferase complex transferase subunit TsaD [Candidatus Omnitrophota bacterium]